MTQQEQTVMRPQFKADPVEKQQRNPNTGAPYTTTDRAGCQSALGGFHNRGSSPLPLFYLFFFVTFRLLHVLRVTGFDFVHKRIVFLLLVGSSFSPLSS